MAPFWLHHRVKEAQAVGDRIIRTAEAKGEEFDQTQLRVLVASRRAEDAAVSLLSQHEVIVAAVAARPMHY